MHIKIILCIVKEGGILDEKSNNSRNGDALYYGSTKDTVEKIMRADGEPIIISMDYYLRYPDDTRIIYRNQQAVLLAFEDKRYITYQKISVGDTWDEVKDREDDWLSVSYRMSDDGLIESITISDHLTAVHTR